ncbi:hypothetical protein DK926_19325 [Rhodococcus sp. Eu-32]|uniref:hypothetical protein n=1 Tax=Rhodococcus sp. Eu-32 TaxID=1017319 RepID=UPI000DF12A85|nr:hypothetical protein [Rhodococcus sp. Eu-32]RRQ26152.1 hypothetical protein DK926_19325 [Rhodococcus sp. Eu-32]
MKDSPTTPDTESSGWLDTHPKAKWLATSRTTGYFSAAVVVLVVVLVTIIVIRGRGEDTPTATPPSIPEATSTTTAPQPDPGSVGGFGPSIADPFGREISVPANEQGQVLPQTDPGERPAFTTGTPVPAPQGIKWERIGATVAPFSTSDGPTHIEGRLAYGFTRTPQGAALAGWQITARMLRGIEDTREAYAKQIVADPGRAERALAALDRTDPAKSATGKALVFPDAFQVTSYSGTTAIVRYATPLSSGRWMQGQATLEWSDQMWKLRDTPPPATTQISTLNGWTRW